MSYYECKRCLHRTKQKVEMSRHLNKKIKCSRNVDSYKYTDEELIEESLKINKNCIHEECNIEQILDNNHISGDDNKCIHCNKTFTRKSSLLRHIDKNRCKSIIYKTEQNITNITNNMNNTIIINVNINKPLPFDGEWDVSKIDNTLRQILLLSDSKYTKTLEHILENDVNLNIIVEDKANCGIVYKNDIEKFKPMKIDDIVDISMDKLHKQLSMFHNEIKDNNTYQINNTLFLSEKEILDEKYDDYKNNEYTQKIVKNYITNIYNKKKDDTIKICSELLEIDNNIGY